MRMIFVNLPVKSVARSREFFGALGFGFNPQFSSDDTACMVIDDNIYAMLLEEERFREFITGDIADAHRSTEVLTALSADSPEQVDELVAAALAAGGAEWKPPIKMDGMYGHSFQDPDGHVWELVWMDMPDGTG